MKLFASLLICLSGLGWAGPIEDFVAAARSQVGVTVRYDPAYTVLGYPGGDVPVERGVCTDVVVRAMRVVGIDLQKEVHEDMRQAFGKYPKTWGLKVPDRNIDHRRVLNLMTFLERRGKKLPLRSEAGAFRAGDLVTCLVPPRLPHIMVVSDKAAPEGDGRLMIIHNIGAGVQEEDRLFEFQLTGHYRWW
jgi:hypothetical protein